MRTVLLLWNMCRSSHRPVRVLLWGGRGATERKVWYLHRHLFHTAPPLRYASSLGDPSVIHDSMERVPNYGDIWPLQVYNQ